ncbi:hypothetical protein D9M69_608920 [compost metagenome]
MAKSVASLNTGRLPALLAMHTRTSAGLRDTEVKELAVKPRGAPSASQAVTMVTPVMKVPKTLRRLRVSSALTGCQSRLLMFDSRTQASDQRSMARMPSSAMFPAMVPEATTSVPMPMMWFMNIGTTVAPSSCSSFCMSQ